jgi:sugar/nucleoside kinase (ribokinase family)
MSLPDVVCYGEIGLDNIIQADRLPSPEVAVFPNAESYHIGGAAANTAVWLAALGVDARLCGNAIGSDAYGERVWQWLKQHPHLDLSLVERRENVQTPYTRAIVTPDGERSFLIFYYPQAPKTALEAPMLAGAKFVALDLYGGAERLEAARTALQAGAQTTIGDVIWPEHAALPLTSIVTNSASYVRSVWPGIDVRGHARALQAVNHGIVITTDGPGDIYVIDRDGSAFTCRPPQVIPVDATGAGDAFRAGLLYGLVRGRDLAAAVRLGAATGSLSTRSTGAATTLAEEREILDLAGRLTVQPV